MKIINEFSSLDENELLEMCNLTGNETGITDIVLWIGSKRIKVSNIPNKISDTDLFTITIPHLKIIGDVDSSFITEEKINMIYKFIRNNMGLILAYSNFAISSRFFLYNIKPIRIDKNL